MMKKKEFLNNVSLLTRVKERKNSIIKNFDFCCFCLRFALSLHS